MIPVYCEHCGAMFSSRMFNFGPNARVASMHLEGNKETCPNCGEMASIVDGVFEVSGNILKLVSGPQFTKVLLSQFAHLLEQARRREIEPEELEKKATELNGELGQVVKQMRASGMRLMPVLLIMLAALHSCKFEMKVDAKLDVNDLLRQGIEYSQTSVNKKKPDNAGKDQKSANPDSAGDSTGTKKDPS
jgi:hypothetical protein